MRVFTSDDSDVGSQKADINVHCDVTIFLVLSYPRICGAFFDFKFASSAQLGTSMVGARSRMG